MKISLLTLTLLFAAMLTQAQPYLLRNSDSQVYTDTVVHRIDIIMEPDSVSDMYNNIRDHEYPATVYISDRFTTDTMVQVAVSLRGNTSLFSAKKSFKISFNSFTPGRKYKKLEKLNLNGEHNDPAICRSKLYWETLAAMNVPGPRANHYEVYINGIYYGLYVNIEHIDENFVESRFDNNGGNLYKCTYPADLVYISQNPDDDKLGSGRRVYELQTNLAEDDYSDLSHFIDQLNNNTTAQFKDSLEKLLNLNAFLRAYAVDIATGHWDGYGFNKNNYFLYKNTETGKFEFIPYDTDNTFGVDWFNISWSSRDIYNWQGTGNLPLISKVMLQNEYRNRFTFFMNQLVQRMGNTVLSVNRLDSLRTQIAPFVVNDTYHSLDYGFSYTDFYNSFDQAWGGHVPEGIKSFIGTRQSTTISQLQNPGIPPLFSETRHIPRFPVSGDSIFIRSWIEDDAPLSNILLTYRWNNGNIRTTPMLDNGTLKDNSAGDGYYGGFAGVASGDTLYYYIQHTDGTGRTGREPRSGWLSVVIKDVPQLAINEWMANNITSIADEAGEYEDWIELYNPSSNDQYLDHICLSDSIDNPGKWKMPDTTISANGFLLLWADEDKSQGPLHMSFKLSSAFGENIYVSYYNGDTYRILDSVNFGSMAPNESIGCLPDGLRPMVVQNPSSPGNSNITVGITVAGTNADYLFFPNPASEVVWMKSSSELFIEVVDMTGKTVLQQAVSEGLHSVDVHTLPAGCYMLLVRSNGSETVRNRLVITR